MTAKEIIMQIIVERVANLESEIETLVEALADKRDELERLARFLETENEFKD